MPGYPEAIPDWLGLASANGPAPPGPEPVAPAWLPALRCLPQGQAGQQTVRDGRPAWAVQWRWVATGCNLASSRATRLAGTPRTTPSTGASYRYGAGALAGKSSSSSSVVLPSFHPTPPTRPGSRGEPPGPCPLIPGAGAFAGRAFAPKSSYRAAKWGAMAGASRPTSMLPSGRRPARR